MKKICFLCPWMNQNGGIQRVVTNLANELIKNSNISIEIVIISKDIKKPYYELDSRINVSYLTSVAKGNLNIKNRAVLKALMYNPIKLNGNIIRKLLFPSKRMEILENFLIERDFDYVISVSGEISLLLSNVNKKNINSKLIAWQHNSYDSYFRKMGKYYYAMEKVAKELYSNLDEIIVLTEDDCYKYKKYMKLNCKTIYNPLSFKCEQKSLVKNNKIVFVGRMEWYQKGLDYLYKVLKEFYKIKDNRIYETLIVGFGKDFKKIKKHIERNQILKENVRLLGNINDVEKIYIKSDLLINTSRWEGFGLVITEAMECGLPVIAFDNSGPREIIAKDTGFLIKKYDIKNFCQKITEVLMNEEKRKRMSKNAILRAADFSKETIINEWYKLLNL